MHLGSQLCSHVQTCPLHSWCTNKNALKRLRPRSGGKRQLTSKALLQWSVSVEEIPAEAVLKYHNKLSEAYPTSQQRASNMDTEYKLDVTVLHLLWSLLGNPG